jgi:exopolysaccharide/PEP-CTERM locus tyrosine autokinase
MGRIEDAIAKLQAERGVSPVPSRPLGRTVDRGLSAPAPAQTTHVYGGKQIVIDTNRLAASGLLAPDSLQRRLEDEYRVIKRPLLRNAALAPDGLLPHGNLLMVASALSGEGKTFTCVNLCLSIAREKDWSVVLVDADCAKPHLSQLFGAEREPGLLDLLRDGSQSFDSFVMPTNIPNLTFLPSGARDRQAAELLASGRMEQLCDDAAAHDARRIVVFDSAPQLLAPESTILSSRVGQILMVVKAFKTPYQAVLSARDKLDPSKAINLLLNEADERDGLGGYGDGYGYGDVPA